ncbi:tetratricopeptide repeat protein [Rodentibacter caecimuris]|uniref:tetratricopeptide repeat protein n=1 Tax=Rodentibacter caecimuris TaxID=1796644 RepID=UPI0009D47E28|nr:hypothetical protein BKG97_01465 [Rodentibacter heylii]
MTTGTDGDKTRDKRKIPENLEKIAVILKKFKESEGYSWKEFANHIYSKIEDCKELKDKYHLSIFIDDKEDEAKNFFNQALKKAIERKQEYTKLNGEKIFLQAICKLLELNNEEELANKETYIQVNTDVLYEKTILWKERFIPKALNEVETAVAQGHKEAQTRLGHFYYYYGENEIRNVKKALELYKSAARQGDRLALYQLGLIYEYGNEEIKADENQAYDFYRKSAEQNFPLALNKLAYYYYSKGVWSSFFEYSEKAEELGDIIGTLYLAYAYKEGLGTNQDIEKAISLYRDLIGKEKAAPYKLDILWTLSMLHKKSAKPLAQHDAKHYLNEYLNYYKEGIEKAWEDNNNDVLNLMTQVVSPTPDKYNRILTRAHYDYVHNPQKPTVISALFNLD